MKRIFAYTGFALLTATLLMISSEGRADTTKTSMKCGPFEVVILTKSFGGSQEYLKLEDGTLVELFDLPNKFYKVSEDYFLNYGYYNNQLSLGEAYVEDKKTTARYMCENVE